MFQWKHLFIVLTGFLFSRRSVSFVKDPPSFVCPKNQPTFIQYPFPLFSPLVSENLQRFHQNRRHPSPHTIPPPPSLPISHHPSSNPNPQPSNPEPPFFRKKLKKWMELLRPACLPPTLLLCITSGWLMNPSLSFFLRPPAQFLAAMLCTLLLTSTSMVINDIYDIELDKINQPTRALPSGIITVPEAISTVLLLLGAVNYLSTTYLSGNLQFLLGLSTALVATYTPLLKRIPFIKNVSCAFLVGLSVIFMGLAASTTILANHIHFPLLTIAMSSVFFGSLYNEIILDMRDVEGDRLHGIYTLPVLFGLPLSYALASFFVYFNLEIHFLTLYYLFDIPRAIGYLLCYSPLILQLHRIREQNMSKESLARASKESTLPLLLILLYLCIIAAFSPLSLPPI